MTTRARWTDDDLESLLVAHFRPLPAGADWTRRLLDALRDDWRPERFVEHIRIDASDRGIRAVHAGGSATPPAVPATATAKRLADAAREELFDYLGGRRTFFSVPVDLSGIGSFQRQVLETTRGIPFGETRTYSWIARAIGHPAAVRAVGTALGRNPVPFIVPCHRVLRSDGGLGGYGLGFDLKTRLLRLERTTPLLEGCSTTRIVCRTGCPHAMRMRDDSRVVFASVADARSVGYRPCRACRPTDSTAA